MNEAEILRNYLDTKCENCGRMFNFALVYEGLSVSPILCTPCLWSDDEF